MKKYFFKDGTLQQGPFDLEELKSKNITAETPVWYEGLPEWTTAGKLEELKDIFIAAPALINTVIPPPPATEVKPVIPVAPEPVITTTAVTTTAAKAEPVATASKPIRQATTNKKSMAWLSWVLSLLVLGAVGYYIYQDMEKNKPAGSNTIQTAVTADSTTTTQSSSTQSSTGETATADTATSPAIMTDTVKTEPTMTTKTQPVTTTPATAVTTPTTTTKPVTAQQTAIQKTAAKKVEEEKKKQLAMQAQKKAEDEKKKLQAAQAAAAVREMEMRNNWPKYVTFGKLNYVTKGDGISAFDVPVYNGTDATLDKVTVRIDYMKKEKKVFKSETIVIYQIPPRSGLNGKAPESKKGEKVNVYITGVNSRKLHFCYPQNNGNNDDPYFCN